MPRDKTCSFGNSTELTLRTEHTSHQPLLGLVIKSNNAQKTRILYLNFVSLTFPVWRVKYTRAQASPDPLSNLNLHLDIFFSLGLDDVLPATFKHQKNVLQQTINVILPHRTALGTAISNPTLSIIKLYHHGGVSGGCVWEAKQRGGEAAFGRMLGRGSRVMHLQFLWG